MQALVARGERVIGWKAGFTSRATQEVFGTDQPVCGFLLGSGVYATGAEVPARKLRRPRRSRRRSRSSWAVRSRGPA